MPNTATKKAPLKVMDATRSNAGTKSNAPGKAVLYPGVKM
jgi:hypothetical protein